ncbi:hypothetical protein NFB68_00380 [Yersinia ruckeri]|uniref:hypothetical protein n=1 Tax=Enterobacterales TaxID=91347 RepID=UPI0021113155|nr:MULTISPECIES: hypothetical protein [Enterobacterales]MCW6518867.1 hypothetical protein [Yersinia ruckeri]MCW6550643.1 hypothetical protein [Yersinia ruckeri]MCW6558015.1 hypothetical protein [Yersinia ruckeri]MCW6576953.1 hypothetical protein [Yersinia ruckeri]MCW6579757.1 hypothetical protein [Yersinia ruckeri]
MLFNKDAYYHRGVLINGVQVRGIIQCQRLALEDHQVWCIFQMIAISCWTPITLFSTCFKRAA